MTLLHVLTLAAIGIQSAPGVQVFLHPDFFDDAAQKHTEASFQHAVTALNSYGFDGYAPGPIPGCSITTSDFVMSVSSGCLTALISTSPIDLIPDTPPNAIFGPYQVDENIMIQIANPRREVGLWIIDSEINKLDTTGNPVDYLLFLSASGATLARVDLPNDPSPYTDNPNLFVGVISSDPIARIELHESNSDEDGVGIDSVQIGVLDSACAGSFRAYGEGCPGEFAVVPRLTVAGCLQAGSLLEISVADGEPSGSIALFDTGFGTAQIPIRYGCDLLVAPVGFSSTPMSLSALESGVTIPVPSGLSQVTLNAQVFLPAPAGLPKFSATNAIEMSFP